MQDSVIVRGGSRGRSRYWCRQSPMRNLTRGVSRYPVVSPPRSRGEHGSGNSSLHKRPAPSRKAAAMDLIYARCAGLDVHKATVVAGVRVPGPPGGERRGEVKTFPTMM